MLLSYAVGAVCSQALLLQPASRTRVSLNCPPNTPLSYHRGAAILLRLNTIQHPRRCSKLSVAQHAVSISSYSSLIVSSTCLSGWLVQPRALFCKLGAGATRAPSMPHLLYRSEGCVALPCLAVCFLPVGACCCLAQRGAMYSDSARAFNEGAMAP